MSVEKPTFSFRFLLEREVDKVKLMEFLGKNVALKPALLDSIIKEINARDELREYLQKIDNEVNPYTRYLQIVYVVRVIVDLARNMELLFDKDCNIKNSDLLQKALEQVVNPPCVPKLLRV